MAYVYVVSWWEGFPQSEYGGVVVVVAKDREHMKELLTDEFGSYPIGRISGERESFIMRMCAAADEAILGPEVTDTEDCGVLVTFTT
tara:strand:+ start:2730 stop:2990 length:261 start_codon:yes stop_codon:yes gene_type:complete